MKSKKPVQRNKERGVAMIIALLAIVLLAIIGSAFMFMANTESSVNNNYKNAQKAYFASRGGLENARGLLQLNSPLYAQTSVLGMPNKVGGGVIYLFTAPGIDPTTGSGNTVATNASLDDELCREQFAGLNLVAGTAGVPCGGDGGANELMATKTYYTVPNAAVNFVPAALPYNWVRINNKQNFMGLMPAGNNTVDGSNAAADTATVLGEQVCFDGLHEIAVAPGACATANPNQIMNPVLVLTSLAASSRAGNNTRRMTQMEVAFPPPLTPNATISAQAPINLQGKLTVNGYDNCKCTTTGASKPGQNCNGTQMAVYSGQPFCGNNSTNCNPGVSQTGNASTLTSPVGSGLTTYNQSTGAVTSQGATGQGPWNYNIPQLVSNYSANAQLATGAPWNGTCTATGGTYPSCSVGSGATFGTYPSGLPSAPVYGPGQGPAQVLIPGSVKLDGNASGSGILIVNGDLEVHGGLAFYGLILVTGEIRFTGGGSQNVNVYGAILAGEDINAQDMAITDTVGGSFSFQYDSCALATFKQQGPPTMLATHEVMF